MSEMLGVGVAVGAVYLTAAVAIPWMLAENASRTAAEHRAAEMAEYAVADAAAEAALVAEFRAAFAAGDLTALLAFCEERIESATPYPQLPTALSFHPQRIDAFYRFSLRRDRLDRYGCTPDGLVHERVPWPLALPADIEADVAVESTTSDVPAASWSLLATHVQEAASDPAVMRIEQLALPEHPDPLLRWHAADGRVLRTSADAAADFAALSALAADAAPAQRPRSPLREPAALLALLAEALPAEAVVHRVFVDHDAVMLDLSVGGRLQRRQFDGFGDPHPSGTADPSAADCPRSPTPAALIDGFHAACAAVPGCRVDAALDTAAFFCEGGSPSNGWHLRVDAG